MISTPLSPSQELLSQLDTVVVLDARAGADAEHAYRQSHLRGALRVHLESDLSAPAEEPSLGGRHPLPALTSWRRRLGDWGISPDTVVAIYDADGGGMAAARAWWMLHAVGHRTVAVVDGGWDALVAAGAPVDAEPVARSAAGPYPTELVDWPVVDAAWVDRIRADPSWRLIDARAPERFRGEQEPIDPVAGHIPGARNLYWKSQLDAKSSFIALDELRARYDSLLGDTTPDRVVCYCGSGVTACHLLLGLEAAGLRGARLYNGSWSEWCRQGRPRGSSV